MKNRIRIFLTMATLLVVSQFSLAGPTEDLWKALKEANYPNALSAIAAGADVKSLDPAYGTPLNFASCWADASVVKALIDAKSEINYIAPANGYNPLMCAAAWGHIEAVKLLLAAGANIKIKNKIGQTFLAASIDCINLEMIKLLVDAGADPNEKYTIGAVTNLTLMNALIMAKEPKEKVTFIETVQAPYLLKTGVVFSDRLKNAKESDFSTLEELAKYLLDKGADPNQKVAGSWGNILMQTLDFGKIGIAKALIENGASYDEKKGMNITDKKNENGIYPKLTYTNGDFVLAAVLSDKLDFIKLMLDKYPKFITKGYEGTGNFKCSSGSGTIDQKYNVEGIDLLMIAAEHGNTEIVRFLIEKGAGRGKNAVAKWAVGHVKTAMCPMKMVPGTMAFARNSGNQEVIDLVKASGHTKE